MDSKEECMKADYPPFGGKDLQLRVFKQLRYILPNIDDYW
jgi:hypothetical protein